jgi:hypothetical protein
MFYRSIYRLHIHVPNPDPEATIQHYILVPSVILYFLHNLLRDEKGIEKPTQQKVLDQAHKENIYSWNSHFSSPTHVDIN